MYGYLAILLTLVGGLNLYIYAREKRIYERRAADERY